MTNQASEDALEQHLLNDKAFQHILKFAPESQRELMTFELARYINSIIRTEKLKLLAEVRERVVGDFEKLDMGGSKEAVSRHNIAYDRNWLRIEQMSALNKLEAEL